MAYAYIEFATETKGLRFNSMWQFTPTHFLVLIGKDPYYAPFPGIFKNFVMNFGDGSFRIGNYNRGETKEIHFGYSLGLNKDTAILPNTYD